MTEPVADEVSLVAKIRSRGYWQFIVRPELHQANRIERRDLGALVARCSVSLRGWDFPHIGRTTPVRRDDYVWVGTDWQHYKELWRMYRSGQFVFIGGFGDDWRDESNLWPSQRDQGDRLLGIEDTIYQFTEFFEFAARLASTAHYDGTRLYLEARLRGLDSRRVYFENRRFGFIHNEHGFAESEWSRSWSMNRDELLAGPSAAPREQIADLLDLGGFHMPVEVIAFHQARLLEGNP